MQKPTLPKLGRPSLSLVVALLAMVVALTATAQALPGKNSVKTDDIKNGAVTTKKIKNKAVTPKKIKDHTRWALVRGDGSLAQGVGVVEVERQSTGIYTLNFDKKVTHRAIGATVYSTGFGDSQVNVAHCDTAHVTGGCGFAGYNGPNSVFVNTEDSAGNNSDSAFLVVVHPATPGVQQFPSPRPVAPRGERR